MTAAIYLEGDWYHCEGCSKYYHESGPNEREVLAQDQDAGTPLDSVYTRTQWLCHDTRADGSPNPCEIDSDEEYDEKITLFPNGVWECGRCESKYRDVDEAVNCCT